MTEVQLKKLLRKLHVIQIQNSLLEEYADLCGEQDAASQRGQKLQAEILKGAMRILNRDEEFVVETHLIDHHSWVETTKLFSERYGQDYERSERTLKRIQSKALKKMLDFINDSPLKDYLIS